MVEHSFGQSGTQSLPTTTAPAVPAPPSFANFRFNTIGRSRTPELLKRISAPKTDFFYLDRRTPSPVLDPEPETRSLRSQSPEAVPIQSGPALLQTSAGTEPIVSDAAEETDIDSTSVREVQVVPFGQNRISAVGPTGIRSSPENQESLSTRSPLSWASAVNNDLARRPDLDVLSRSISIPHLHEGVASNFSLHQSALPMEPTLYISTDAFTTSGGPAALVNGATHRPTVSVTHEHESPYTTLRALQTRLLSSLSTLSPPNTSPALLIVQAANSHSTTALSAAHRAHILAQQSLASAQESVVAAQECLTAAEQAKAHVGDAMSAVVQISGGEADGVRGPKSEWEWKVILAGLRDDLHILGEWIGERESEEATRRRKQEMADKARDNKEYVESVMRMTDHEGLDPLIIKAMSAEVVQRSAVEEFRSRPDRVSCVPVVHSTSARYQQAQRSAEVEADTARRAWNLDHENRVDMRRSLAAEEEKQRKVQEALEQEKRRVQEEADALQSERIRLAEESRKREEEEEASRRQAQEAETKARRMRELELKKLEVARFQMQERERPLRVQQEEMERHATEVKATELQSIQDLVEQCKKRQELEDTKHCEVERLVHETELAKRLVEQTYAESEERAKMEQQMGSGESAKRREPELSRMTEVKELEEEQAKQLMDQQCKELEQLAGRRDADACKEFEAAMELELREAQEKKRQEVMAQKQRANAEIAAKILSERAKQKQSTGGTALASESPGSHCPPNHLASRPQTQSPSTGQSGNLVARGTLVPSTPEAVKPRARTISGRVRLGSINEQPDSSLPPSSTFAHSVDHSSCRAPKVQGTTPSVSPPQPSAIRDQAGLSGSLAKSLKLGDAAANQTSDIPPGPPRSAASSVSAPNTNKPGADNMPIISHAVASSLPPADDRSPKASTPEELAATRDVSVPIPTDYQTRGLGSIPLALESRTPQAPSRAQAVNLRLQHSANGALRDTYWKPNPEHVIVKAEPLEEELTYPQESLSPCSVVKLNGNNGPTSYERSIKRSQVGVAPASPTVPSTSTSYAPVTKVNTSTTCSAMQKSPNSLRPKETDIVGSRLLGLTTNASDYLKPISKYTGPRVPLKPRQGKRDSFNVSNAHRSIIPAAPTSTGANDPSSYENSSQITPEARGDSGRAGASTRTVGDMHRDDSRAHNVIPRVDMRRGDHYSPPLLPGQHASRHLPSQDQRTSTVPGAPGTRRPNTNISSAQTQIHIPPLPRSSPPVLGKRRYSEPERSEDMPPTRRRWPSPPSHEREREDQSFRAHPARSAPLRPELYTPCPERPGALESRMGVIDYSVYRRGGGQSYRPIYATDAHPTPSWRISDNYQPEPEPSHDQDHTSIRNSTPYDRNKQLGRHQVVDRPDLLDRMTAGSSNHNPFEGRQPVPSRGHSKSRAGRGGGRPLEQRISSSKKPLALMHRLESPPPNYT